ncbi:MAG: hypothetical protein CBC35_10140 [Planctomycetes bacterium TMED75]|nr:hypothetical protein [Planctomycetaceae bacterium]OUU91116.1 MAG: hypothetical protein CBC35_10140 [Planctomycetes bacterium TMED75]
MRRIQRKAVRQHVEKTRDTCLGSFYRRSVWKTNMNSSVKVLRRKIDPTGQISSRDRKSALSSNEGLLSIIVSGWVVGTWAGLALHIESKTIGLACALTLSILMLFGRTQRRSVQIVIMVSGFALLGALRSSIESSGVLAEHQPIHDIADGRIVELHGRVKTIDENVAPRTGLVERFGYNPSAHVLQVQDAVIKEGPGSEIEMKSVLIRVASSHESTTGLRIGDLISLRGTLHGGRRVTNPGMEISRTIDPWVKVPHQELISIRHRGSDHHNGIGFWLKAWRIWVVETLEESMSDWGSDESRALVRAMVVGDRTTGFDELMIPYRRTGLAHYLAVSGFALGVMIAVPRCITPVRSRFVRNTVVLVTIVIAMASIELRAPAWRAGIVALVVGIGSLLGRDWKRTNLLALAALILLMVNPRELLNPGFQLSFLVVASLLVLAPILDKRLEWCSIVLSGKSGGSVLVWFRKSCSCGLVAWAAASPIVFYHFGIVSPAGALMSILAGPLVALIIVLSVGSILLATAVPWMTNPAGPLASISAEFLNHVAVFFSSLPGCCFLMHPPNVVWVIGCEYLLWRGLLEHKRWERYCMCLVVVILVVWMIPDTPRARSDSIELTTLDVGNGTCHLVKGGGGWVMVDSGSSSTRSACAKILFPAVRTLGIERFDAVFISHPNIDHFSMLADLMGRIVIDQIVIGHSFIDHAETPEGEASRLLLEIADEWNIELVTAGAGAQIDAGGLIWDVLHPRNDFHSDIQNDHSLVLGARRRSVSDPDTYDILFTGDIEELGMRSIMSGSGPIQVGVLEAPHHGSIRRSTEAFLNSIQFDLLVQSTGRGRLIHDYLGALIEGRRRMITALHGAIQVDIGVKGELKLETY